MRLSTSALTISRERAGAKRQSVLKLTIRNRLSRAGAKAADRSPPCAARRVEVVERARDQQVGVGVEVLAELVALVAQVALDLELDVLRRVAEAAVAQLAAELGLHRVVGQVRDVADHARHAQPARRHHAVAVVVAAVEVGVGDDGAARHLVERDVLRRQIRRRRHRDAVAHALRMAQRPGQRLHAAQAAADHRGELGNAQRVDQARLRIDPVLDRHHRKVGAVRLAGGRVGVHRPGRAEARAQVVDADDEEAVGVQRLAGPHQVVPPALLPLCVVVAAGDMVAGVQRMAHQHRVAGVGVERAVGLVDQRVVRQRRAAAQRQRLLEVTTLWSDDTDGMHGPEKPKTGAAADADAGFGASLFSGISIAPASRNKSAL